MAGTSAEKIGTGFGRGWRLAAAMLLTAALSACGDAETTTRSDAPGDGGGSKSASARPDGERQGGGRRGGRKSLVSAVDVRLDTINDRMSAVGTARAQQRATLLTQAAGVVEEVLFKPGDRVEKGAPLLRLDRRAEEIAILRAKSALDLAKATLDRLNRLGANATEVARQDATNAVAVAEADLAAAEYEFSRKEVRAPFAGVVGITDVYEGQYATAGTAVATLDNRDTLILTFNVPERAMGLDLVGKTVRANARTERGRFYEGEITAVDSRVDAATRTLRAEANMPNPEGRLLPGATYSVSVVLVGEPAPTVPALAVQWDRRGAHVWRIKHDDTVERVDVVIVKREGDQVALKATLQEGDQVVYEGGDQLSPGAAVAMRGGGGRGEGGGEGRGGKGAAQKEDVQ